jgi:hypothetical protein
MANCVTYEQALWLKNVIKSEFKYDENGFLFHSNDYHSSGSKFTNSISAPEQHEVIEWLRVKHWVWVYTKPIIDEDGEWIFKGYIKLMNNFKAKEYQTKLCREPQEAYSAAFNYIRTNNLI